jgi:4'-phosphopantetheinyl transferase
MAARESLAVEDDTQSWPDSPAGRGASSNAGVWSRRGPSVQVWCCDLDVPQSHVPVLARWLSDAEKQRASRFRSPVDRDRYIVAHARLRAILGSILGTSPGELSFGARIHGKPYLIDGGLEFNLSHSAGRALIAVSGREPVGIDVERIGVLDELDLAKRFFSAREVDGLRALAGLERTWAFYRCWSRKEAYLKGLGCGLKASLDRFSVSIGEKAELVWVDPERGQAQPWHIEDVSPGGGYVAAVATRGARRPIARWRWSLDHDRAFARC